MDFYGPFSFWNLGNNSAWYMVALFKYVFGISGPLYRSSKIIQLGMVAKYLQEYE